MQPTKLAGRLVFSAASLTLLIVLGCSRGPSRVHPPEIDPDDAGSAAVTQHDADGDGVLSQAELANLPGILGAIGWYDLDSDGNVSADEIAQRIRKWHESRVGLLPPIPCTVLLDGQPLSGATVKWIPEPYLGETFKPGSGTTDNRGIARIRIAQSDMSPDQQDLSGMQVGVFKVQITHPTESIPARYNTETTLGEEISLDRRIRSPRDITFQLLSQ